MTDNLKKQLLKKAHIRTKNAEFYEFETGTAIVAKHKALFWFNSSNKYIFKFVPDEDDIKNRNDKFSKLSLSIFKVTKVNEWLKVYFKDNKVIPVLADNRGYLMKNGSYLYYHAETYHPMLSEISVNNNILSYNGKSIAFTFKIDDVQYYDNGFIVLANSHMHPCPENWLTLYSVSEDCRIRWQIADYTKLAPICKYPKQVYGLLYNDRIDTFTVEGNYIYAKTPYYAYRLKIDAETGKTVSYYSFAYLR